MEVERKKVSSLLLKLRKTHEFSQEEMADYLGISARTVRNWEKGLTMPSIEDVTRICTLFNLSVDGFLKGDFRKQEDEEKDEKQLKDMVLDLNKKISKAEETIARFNDNTEIEQKSVHSVRICLVAFMVHLITAFVNYKLFFEGPPVLLAALIVSIAYIFVFLRIISTNHDNTKTVFLIIIYFSILVVNTLILTSLYDSAFGNAGFVEFFVFNGSLYGLMILKPSDFIFLLKIERVVYIILIALCSYFVFSERKKEL